MDDKQYDHPIYYASKQFMSVEINYTVTEREELGDIYASKKFHHYLYGTKITVWQAIKYWFNFFTNKMWREYLYGRSFCFKNRVRNYTSYGYQTWKYWFLSWMEKEMGVVFKDDNFSDTMLMSVDINNNPDE